MKVDINSVEDGYGGFLNIFILHGLSVIFFTIIKGGGIRMLEFLLIILLLFTFISLTPKSNVFFNYIRIQIKVIGLDVEIKSKEKSAPSNKR